MPRRPDRKTRRDARRNPSTSKKAQAQLTVQLNQVARTVGSLTGQYDLFDPIQLAQYQDMMRRYSEMLTPWAEKVSGRMLADVNRRDQMAWLKHSEMLSEELRHVIRNTDVGATMRQLMAEQVTLIKSMPLDAAKRVHELVIEGLSDSTRANEIADMIAETGQVTASRGQLIARTEVARTATSLTEARSLANGWPTYKWRTVGDGSVRKSHREMEGKIIRWDSPPTLSDGTTTHAGAIFNCRCFPVPQIEGF